MSDSSDRLPELASRCLVRLGHGPDNGGSGVWIAPGTILTCAHVVPSGPGSEVKVEWWGQLLTGVVVDHVPNPQAAGLWPFPDLAIVEVAPAPAHPCAWLCERHPGRKAELIAYGHSGKLGEGLRPTRVDCRFGGEHAFGTGTYWQIQGNEFVAGMSGGPVLDVATGAVCALVTTTLGEGADRGGYAVPVGGLALLGGRRRLLAAHDRFHAHDLRWTSLRHALPAPGKYDGLPIEPFEEVALLGRLASRPERAANRDEVYRLLDEYGVGDRWVTELLRLAHRLGDLDDWSTALATRTGRWSDLVELRSSPAEPVDRGGVISIEIVPGTTKVDRFRLTVSIEEAGRKRRVLHKQKEPAYGLSEVQQVATEHLRRALELLEGDAIVEFVVPVELFDVPFDELRPQSPYTNVGRQHQVVLRDYDRQRDRSGWHAWKQRWRQLAGPSGEVRWMTCGEEVDPSDLWSELGDHPGAGILALTRRPTSNDRSTEALRVALEAGMPAVVWRRDTCPEHDSGVDEPACTGEQFRAAIDAVLSADPARELPVRVRQLRSRAASSKANAGEQACRGTVLVWDDADRAIPAAPLHEPSYRPGEP